MPLVATSGAANADTYLDLSAIKSRMDDIGFVYTSVYSDPELEAAARKATVWLDGTFIQRWPGTPSASTQSREWPRSDATDRYGNTITGIPTVIGFAQVDAMIKELQSPGFLSPSANTSQTTKRVKGGPAEIEYFEPNAGTDLNKPAFISSVENLLSRILRSSGESHIFVV